MRGGAGELFAPGALGQHPIETLASGVSAEFAHENFISKLEESIIPYYPSNVPKRP
jgi:hypothetical protein